VRVFFSEQRIFIMRIVFFSLAAGLTAGFLASSAFAAEPANNQDDKYVFVTGNLVEADDDRVTGRGVRMELGLGRKIASHWYLEAIGSGTILNGSLAQKDLYVAAGLVNLQWVPMMRGNKWMPFVDGALGLAKNEDVGLLAQAGFGIVSPDLSSYKVRLRLQAHAGYDDSADGALDYTVGAGLEFPIGTKAIVKTVEVERVVERVVEKEVFRAPQDTDMDGVIDRMDRCPQTLAGSRVDQAGCTVAGQAMTLKGVNFASSSDRLSPESYTTLNAALAAMQGQPTMRVKVNGHTDSTGSAAFNMSLSQKRADAVKRYFVAKGIDAARITAKGYGEAYPITSNLNNAGRALNRRVEFEVIN
jgi:OOP family OmpA-OmpF porin